MNRLETTVIYNEISEANSDQRRRLIMQYIIDDGSEVYPGTLVYVIEPTGTANYCRQSTEISVSTFQTDLCGYPMLATAINDYLVSIGSPTRIRYEEYHDDTLDDEELADNKPSVFNRGRMIAETSVDKKEINMDEILGGFELLSYFLSRCVAEFDNLTNYQVFMNYIISELGDKANTLVNSIVIHVAEDLFEGNV